MSIMGPAIPPLLDPPLSPSTQLAFLYRDTPEMERRFFERRPRPQLAFVYRDTPEMERRFFERRPRPQLAFVYRDTPEMERRFGEVGTA
jgi:hypothetical protein